MTKLLAANAMLLVVAGSGTHALDAVHTGAGQDAEVRDRQTATAMVASTDVDPEKSTGEPAVPAYLASIFGAAAALADYDVRTAQGWLERVPEDRRNWEWHYLHAQADQSLITLPILRSCPLVVSGDGTKVLAGSDGGPCSIWDIASETEIPTVPGSSRNLSMWTFAVKGALFPPDGEEALIVVNNKVERWDLRTGIGECVVDLGSSLWGANCLGFSPNGEFVVVSQPTDHHLPPVRELWNVSTQQRIAGLSRSSPIGAVAFSPDSRTLVTVATGAWYGTFGVKCIDEDPKITVWNAETGQVIHTFTGCRGKSSIPSTWGGSHERSLAFSPDSRLVAWGASDGNVYVWSIDEGTLRSTLAGVPGGITDVAFSPDGQKLAAAGSDKTVVIWDVAKSKRLVLLVGHRDVVTSIAFDRDGNRIVTGSLDTTVRLWDAETGALTATLLGHEQGVSSVTFALSDTRIVSHSQADPNNNGGSPGAIKIWDVKSVSGLRLCDYGSGGPYLLFSDDGARLFRACDNENVVNVFDAYTLEHLADFPMDGVSIATDRTVVKLVPGQFAIIRAGRGVRWNELRGPVKIKYTATSPDGALEATGLKDGRILLGSAASSTESRRTLVGHRHIVRCLDFSPDGSRLVSAAADGTVRFWDVRSGVQLLCWNDNDQSVNSVRFSPDGTRIASGGGWNVWTTTIRDQATYPQRRRRLEKWEMALGQARETMARYNEQGLSPMGIVKRINEETGSDSMERAALWNMFIKSMGAVHVQRSALGKLTLIAGVRRRHRVEELRVLTRRYLVLAEVVLVAHGTVENIPIAIILPRVPRIADGHGLDNDLRLRTVTGQVQTGHYRAGWNRPTFP